MDVMTACLLVSRSSRRVLTLPWRPETVHQTITPTIETQQSELLGQLRLKGDRAIGTTRPIPPQGPSNRNYSANSASRAIVRCVSIERRRSRVSGWRELSTFIFILSTTRTHANWTDVSWFPRNVFIDKTFNKKTSILYLLSGETSDSWTCVSSRVYFSS